MQYEEVEVNSERWFDLTPLLNEEFRNIKDYENYQVSNYGRIKSFIIYGKYKNIRILKAHKNYKGYFLVSLTKNKQKKLKLIHRLVAQEFIGNKFNKPQINHIDGNKQNNMINNLEWCNNSENQIHAIKNGLKNMSCLTNKTSFKTIQYDMQMNKINEFKSASEASRITGVSQTGISLCCRTNGKIKGFKFRYEL